MDRTITAPIDRETLKSLHAGDYVYISGTIYTARDAAHKRMIETLDEGRELPLDLKDNVIYYMGPSPAREGRPIGSAGPTTASRMDGSHDRKRKEKPGSHRCHRSQWCRLFCGSGRSRSNSFKVH